jgi:hypothetical protein
MFNVKHESGPVRHPIHLGKNVPKPHIGIIRGEDVVYAEVGVEAYSSQLAADDMADCQLFPKLLQERVLA